MLPFQFFVPVVVNNCNEWYGDDDAEMDEEYGEQYGEYDEEDNNY